MKPTNWISRNVSRLLPAVSAEQKEAPALDKKAQTAIKSGANAERTVDADKRPRSTHVRLKATLGQKDEALSPRVLRRILQELHAIIDPKVSEVEGGRRAQAIAAWYAGATPEHRRDLWLLRSRSKLPRCSLPLPWVRLKRQ